VFSTTSAICLVPRCHLPLGRARPGADPRWPVRRPQAKGGLGVIHGAVRFHTHVRRQPAFRFATTHDRKRCLYLKSTAPCSPRGVGSRAQLGKRADDNIRRGISPKTGFPAPHLDTSLPACWVFPFATAAQLTAWKKHRGVLTTTASPGSRAARWTFETSAHRQPGLQPRSRAGDIGLGAPATTNSEESPFRRPQPAPARIRDSGFSLTFPRFAQFGTGGIIRAAQLLSGSGQAAQPQPLGCLSQNSVDKR